MNLEHDLKRALHRKAPAPGLAGRVLERIEREPHRAARPIWWRAAAASVALAAVLGGYTVHHVAEVRRAEKAKEQVLIALRIAGEKVRYAQQQVHDIGSH